VHSFSSGGGARGLRLLRVQPHHLRVQLQKAHSAGQNTLRGIVLRRGGEEAAQRMRECEEVAARALAADVDEDEVSEHDDQAVGELVDMDSESEEDEELQAL
jgi:hypothetical protein